MKTQRLISIALICLSLLLTTRNARAQVYPVVAYAQVTGRQQGNFTGNTTIPGFGGQIALINAGVSVEGHGRFYIQLYPGASNAQFEKAFSNNEVLTRVFIQMVKYENGQVVPKAYKTYELKNAAIYTIKATTPGYSITFTAGQIDVNNL